MRSPQITLRGLHEAVERFAGAAGPDAGWVALQSATTPAIDLAVPTHRRALHVWLNAWGCRLRYSRPGEPDLFDSGIAEWWQSRQHELPAPGVTLANLDEAELLALGECYAELAAVPVSAGPRRRSVGPTAATKLLHALRPAALMPWDEAIARALHGGRSGAAYLAHQRLGRDWARSLLAEAAMDEAELSAHLGQPGRPLAKMLDDYCYLVYTRGHVLTAG